MRSVLMSLGILTVFLLLPAATTAQDPQAIRSMIQTYKTDARGPYRDIRWFCKDGTTVGPQERCPDGGVQRARYKDEVVSLGNKQHIFLGQILSTTPQADFWDASFNNSRLKQYQLQNFLVRNDDGWILRKAIYYRGAVQAEDETAWGREFLTWLLKEDDILIKQFYLVREAAKDIPHGVEDNKIYNIRAVSKAIADTFPSFMNLRVKIHGKPEASDLEAVKAFRKNNLSRLSNSLTKQFDVLIRDMEAVYQTPVLAELKNLLKEIPAASPLHKPLASFNNTWSGKPLDRDGLTEAAGILERIRDGMTEEKLSRTRLALLDISLKIEQAIFQALPSWQPYDLQDLALKIHCMGKVAYATGFLEKWEWEIFGQRLSMEDKESLTLQELSRYLENTRTLVESGTGMTKAVYKDVLELYVPFEPKVEGFVDDRIRSSVMLHLGQSLEALRDLLMREGELSNAMLDLSSQGSAWGLNPGYAKGELVVIEGSLEEIEVSSKKIYVFETPPADLKPVAGIATVTEGNPVSHVQLLARNLGIPNAVVSLENLKELKKYEGTEVFYAVSPRGTVIMKEAGRMNEQENKLFEQKAREETRVRVPVDKIDLNVDHVVNMADIDASYSGVICGPKAANLAQLKKMFPDKVVEGLVIPFGIFRQHLDQTMPGMEMTYWEKLNLIFQTSSEMELAGSDPTVIESYVLGELKLFSDAIKKIGLLPGFVTELERLFSQVLGRELGSIPVFLRSDTNMEDLKDFTGAGLNLTVFNVVDREKIFQGIRDVWASPYSDRSYKWRQKFLLNPENVYPSILIIPSVDVDVSGVMITQSVATGEAEGITLAFNRGVAGAVEGQQSETWLLGTGLGYYLQKPARENQYTKLPVAGGTAKAYTTFERPVLHSPDLAKLKEMALQIREKLPQSQGAGSTGPYDVELGLKDGKLWLFQVRPFVENKRAASSEYLLSISPSLKNDKRILLNTIITE